MAYNTGQQEWYTPSEYLAAARQVMGAIDLDPASSPTANLTVQAATYYTVDDDGMNHPWHGRVWLNPPYSTYWIGRFIHKLCEHLASGDVSEAIVLVNNATDTRWFQEIGAASQALCLVVGRVRFLNAAGEPGAPLQGQIVLYAGPNVERFIDTFRAFGSVRRAWRPEAMEQDSNNGGSAA